MTAHGESVDGDFPDLTGLLESSSSLLVFLSSVKTHKALCVHAWVFFGVVSATESTRATKLCVSVEGNMHTC